MKQYLKLLMVREGKEVLGKHFSNLWLLTLVLVATFASIAFSEGSMVYLQDKMEDPFTNWLDIPMNSSSTRFQNLQKALDNPAVQQKYGFGDVHGDREQHFDMQGTKDMYLRCRHFARINTPLMQKILAPENIVGGCVIDSTKLTDASLGIIITIDAVRRLGFKENEYPAYIDYKAYNKDADTLGLQLIEDEFLRVPFPVLAIVRRLPNNVDMMGTNYLSEQPKNADTPFDFKIHPAYISELRYFVENGDDIESITAAVKSVMPDTLKNVVQCVYENNSAIETWKPGRQVAVDFGEKIVSMNSHQWLALDKKIMEVCKDFKPQRIYNYETSHSPYPDDYISLNFTTLEHIRDFEAFVKSEADVQIDMSQVASKENFNAVTVMAAILSAAMVIFSIVCIIMFLVNMLQSYFQKVKRNIGTFKAFGMNTRELTQVYIFILILIVLAAVLIALAITWGIQCLLPLIGVEKDGFNYLSLWNNTTYIATAVVLISTVATVIFVMTRMLSQTPGDLIYDRN